MSQLETRDVWPEIVRLKDEASLAVLAERFGATPGEISAAFKRTGTLRRARPTLGDALPPEPGDVTMRTLSPEVSAALDRIRPGSKDTLIARHADLLGNVPDAEVARRAGVSVRTVASFRARHGIAGYRGPRRSRGRAGPRRSRIDPYADLLGAVPDRAVADKAGVSVNAVRNYRVKRGIAAAGRQATVISTPGVSLQAWKITWRGEGAEREGVVLASDLVAAATAAERIAPGNVMSMVWAGPFVSA